MSPETVATLAKAAESVAGGGATGVLVLFALWLRNRKNGNGKFVSEDVCLLHQESLKKDIGYMKESLSRVEQLIRNGQVKEFKG